jgi:drug/metabolite transporter (DMT)-like permease
MIIGALLALGAATAYGVNAILVKEGIQRFGVALPGLVVALVVGLASMVPLALRSRPSVRPPAGAVVFLVLSGFCASIGIGSYFLALAILPVSVVAPISNAYPLVTLLIARVFLKRSERVTWRIGLGAACVVAGVALIALNRSQ